MSLRICHVVRPAEGGMLSQVRSLLDEHSLLAAPPAVLAALANDSAAPFPLSASGSLRAQLRDGRVLGRWVRGKAEVLHGHGLARAPLFAIAARAAGLPLVVTLHNLVPPLNPIEWLAARIALSVARRVICVSEAVSRSAALLVPAHKRTVIYNGVPLPSPREGDTPHDSPIVLCIARLSPEKGVDVLLKAMASLPEARLLIAGDGPERAALEASAPANVTFLGFRQDVPALLTEATVVAVPSRQEGLGLAALEAMAAGVPVVASDVGGLREVVLADKTGLLVPPDAPEALASALRTLLTDAPRREELSKAGRVRIAATFDREVMARRPVRCGKR
jgi:glycosyltransferase involved in cell wall biosynthesis